MNTEKIEEIKRALESNPDQSQAIEHHKRVMAALKDMGVTPQAKPKTFQVEEDDPTTSLPTLNGGTTLMFGCR